MSRDQIWFLPLDALSTEKKKKKSRNPGKDWIVKAKEKTQVRSLVSGYFLPCCLIFIQPFTEFSGVDMVGEKYFRAIFYIVSMA